MYLIKTKEDWWDVLERYWENIENLIFTYHPSNGYKSSMKITAEGAERACETVRRLIATESREESLNERVKRCKETKSEEMATILNETWFGVPESVEAHYIPSFGVLCDLCSERWVFDEVEINLDKEDET